MFDYFAGQTDKPRKLTACAAILSSALLIQSPNADARWKFNPSIGAGFEHDTNPVLRNPDIVESVNGYLLEAAAEFSYESPVSDFTLTPSVHISRYDELSALDSEDVYLDMRYVYTGERSNFRFRAKYSDVAARKGERSRVDFDIDDPDELPSDDSGQILLTTDRQRIYLAPRWSYALTTKSRVVVGATHISSSYDRDAAEAVTDFDETTGRLGYEFDFSERNTLTFESYFRNDHFEESDDDVSGYGALLGITHAASEQSRFRVKIGVDSTEDELSDRHSNAVGEISYIRNLERSRIIASYQRTVTGNGSGRVSPRDSIDVNFEHNFNPRTAVNVGVRTYQAESLVDGEAASNNRDYVQFRTMLTRNITETFSVQADYTYTYLNRRILSYYADSNRFTIWLRYTPIR